MRRIALADNLAQYAFPPSSGKHFGYNIYALKDGGRALLIDAGYPRHAEVVRAELETDGVTIEGVVVSHFHEDHVAGLAVLPVVPVTGSAVWGGTIAHHTPDGWHSGLEPSHLVATGSQMTFGSFDLEFISAPGHSACSLHTVIDGRFVHVADTMLTSNDGNPILPWAERDDLAAHVDALESLRGIADMTLLPGHGVCLSGAGRINREIDLRVRYLRAVASTAPPVPYDDCVREGDREFLHREWHEVLHGGGA